MRSNQRMVRVMEQQSTSNPCLAGGGELGRLMRTLDWSQTALGPVQAWPQSLCTAVSICLNSRFPMLIWWGAELIMLYNDAYRPILGLTKHPQALGKCGEASWPEIWPVIGPMLRSVLTDGNATWSNDQLLVLDRNGYLEECYFTFSYSPIRDEQGQVGGVFTAVTETTAQVISARRLQTVQDLASRTAAAQTVEAACALAVQSLADNRADLPFALLYVLDEDQQKLCLLGATGLRAGEAASPVEVDLTAHPSTPALWPFAQVMAEGQVVEAADVMTRFGDLPGGVWLASPTTALLLPIPSATQEQPIGLLLVGISPRRMLDQEYRDFLQLVVGQVATAIANALAYVAERQRAEALAELDRAKNAFFSNISHEFRTPLTLMLGPLAELLQQPQALATNLHVQLEMAYGNGLRLLKLVNTLLDFSRLQEGRLQAHFEPIALAAYTAELASVFRSVIEHAGLQLVVDCPPLPQLVAVDREMWEKIVLNLLSNAFKFTLTGTITVALTWQGDEVALTVSDTGIGIPAAELPHIFRRFHRVRGVVARTQEGSGIGLALVQELSKLHDGTAQVVSVVGEGSTFTVTIPIKTPSALACASTAGSANEVVPARAAPYLEEAARWLPSTDFSLGQEQNALALVLSEPLKREHGFSVKAQAEKPKATVQYSKPMILLADDNADMRSYLTRLLSPYYQVMAVANGVAALAAMRTQQPDLVLMDVMMPEMDGFALLQIVRRDPQLCATPIILLSARAGEESRIEGLQAGADDYLVKPFSARELVARIDAHLALQRLRHTALNALQESEATLHAREAQLQRVIEGSNDGFWDWNVQSGDMYVSPRWYAILGYAPNEFILDQATLERLVHPDDLAQVQALVAAVLDGSTGQERYTVRHRYLKKDGSVCWVRARGGITQRDEAGRILVLSGTITDITAHKATDDALRESEARFRNMADNAPTMIWVTDATGACIFLNRSWYSFTGQTIADGLGFGWLNAVHPEDRATAEAVFLTANTRHTTFQVDYRLRRYDGVYRWVVDAAAPRFGENGEYLGYVGSVTDIDERKLIEQALRDSESELRLLTATLEQRVTERTAELERSNRELDQFAYVASHDLKTPLRGIYNLATWITEDAGSVLPEPSIAHLVKLRGRVQRMERLLDDLLAYSRVGRRDGKAEIVQVKPLLEEVIYLLAPPDGFTIHLQSELPTIVTPHTPLELVFRNLIGNAIKHHHQPEHGQLYISACDLGNYIEFCVRDNGPGIEPQHHERIFGMFQVLRPRDEIEGSGMGLAIVKKAVEYRKGRVRLESMAGQGTTFYFTWPKTSVAASEIE